MTSEQSRLIATYSDYDPRRSTRKLPAEYLISDLIDRWIPATK